MMIFNAKYGDPVLLDSTQGLRELHEELERFLASSESDVSFQANVVGDPAPYDELLEGLRIVKSSNSNSLNLTKEKWLVLSSSPEELSNFSYSLLVRKDGDHTHWRSSPLSIIIEADEWKVKNA